MAIQQNKMTIGGNSILVVIGKGLLKIGNFITKNGETIIKSGNEIIVTNPSVEFINPFTLLAKFTVDNNLSYQLVVQSNYIDKYKEDKTLEKLTEEEKFMIINQNIKFWYLKTNEI